LTLDITFRGIWEHLSIIYPAVLLTAVLRASQSHSVLRIIQAV
jgi:hypothetical protein